MSLPGRALSWHSSGHILSTTAGLEQPEPLVGTLSPRLHDSLESLNAPLTHISQYQISQYMNSNQRSTVQYTFQVARPILVKQIVGQEYLWKRLKSTNSSAQG